jgi:hypothetical protein
MRRYYCDICNTELMYLPIEAKIGIIYELCSKCAHELSNNIHKWKEEKKKQPVEKKDG